MLVKNKGQKWQNCHWTSLWFGHRRLVALQYYFYQCLNYSYHLIGEMGDCKLMDTVFLAHQKELSFFLFEWMDETLFTTSRTAMTRSTPSKFKSVCIYDARFCLWVLQSCQICNIIVQSTNRSSLQPNNNEWRSLDIFAHDFAHPWCVVELNQAWWHKNMGVT